MDKLKIITKTYVINNDEQVLALRRSATDTHRPLTWDIPGGAMELGESPRDSAAREAKEEAGLELTNLVLLDVVSEVFPDKQIVTIIYSARVNSPEIHLSYEHDKYEWLTKEKFLKIDIPKKYQNGAKLL